MLGSLVNLPATVVYAALFLIVGGESAGVPLPGETSLVTAGILAAQGHLSLPLVIGTAAAGAIVGDNLGYLLGRHGGRWLLGRDGRWSGALRRVLARSEPFFERHGAKAVFFGRWLPGLRVAAAWLAGVNRMPWRCFALWNTLGGVAWATSVGIAAYLLGHIAATIFRYVGVGGLAALSTAIVALLVWHRISRIRARRERDLCGPTP